MKVHLGWCEGFDLIKKKSKWINQYIQVLLAPVEAIQVKVLKIFHWNLFVVKIIALGPLWIICHIIAVNVGVV